MPGGNQEAWKVVPGDNGRRSVLRSFFESGFHGLYFPLAGFGVQEPEVRPMVSVSCFCSCRLTAIEYFAAF